MISFFPYQSLPLSAQDQLSGKLSGRWGKRYLKKGRTGAMLYKSHVLNLAFRVPGKKRDGSNYSFFLHFFFPTYKRGTIVGGHGVSRMNESYWYPPGGSLPGGTLTGSLPGIPTLWEILQLSSQRPASSKPSHPQKGETPQCPWTSKPGMFGQ